MLTVKIEHDESPECPMDWDGSWTLHSFHRQHSTFTHHQQFRDDNGNWKLSIRNKLRAGTAFWLSYFEHGMCKWGRQGTMSNMPDFCWDGVETAGLLIWEHPVTDMGAKTYEDRVKDANGFLETYTNFCNGCVYGYVVEDEDGDTVDSCWGFYDDNSLKEAVKEAVGDNPFQVEQNDYAEMIA